jgi:hypothetical protein
MVRVDNSTFSIYSANITGYNLGGSTSPYSYTETVKGYLNGALVAQESFFVPIAYSIGVNVAVHQFTAAGFANVDRVEFTQITTGSYTYQFIDNIQVPSTTAAAADIKVLINDTDIDHGAVVTINQVAATSAMGAAVSLNADGSLHYNPLVSAALTSLAQRDFVTDVVMYTPQDQFGAVGNQAAVYINLTGTINTNVFAIHTGDSVHTITSFNAAANGDVLNLQDLLVGSSVTSASLSEYVQLTTVGGNTAVMVDMDGVGAGAAIQVATLTGVTGLLLSNLDTNHNVVYA